MPLALGIGLRHGGHAAVDGHVHRRGGHVLAEPEDAADRVRKPAAGLGDERVGGPGRHIPAD